MSNFSILINSCDKYSDVWEPFFRILEKSWPEAKNYPIYLNTETKVYTDSFYNVVTLNCIDEEGLSKWGKRLRDVLDRIETDYVLFLLEDFFFEEPVNHEEVLKGIEYLDRDKNIVTISFIPQNECENEVYCKLHEQKSMPGYILRKQKTNYKLSAGPSIWRKSLLKKWTLDSDTPWGWEFFGSKRTWFSKDSFYCRSAVASPVFVYDYMHGGAVHRGKWVGYKMRELMEKYGIEIDMSQRIIEEDYLKENRKPLPIYKRLTSILTNKVKLANSLVYGFFYR